MRGLIFLILVSSNNIFSILEIEILKGSDNLSKIAFIPFGIEKNIDEKYGDQVSSLIEKNMVLFGEFENLNKNEMLSFPINRRRFLLQRLENNGSRLLCDWKNKFSKCSR